MEGATSPKSWALLLSDWDKAARAVIISCSGIRVLEHRVQLAGSGAADVEDAIQSANRVFSEPHCICKLCQVQWSNALLRFLEQVFLGNMFLNSHGAESQAILKSFELCRFSCGVQVFG